MNQKRKIGIIVLTSVLQLCIGHKLLAQEKTLDPVTVSSSLIEKRSSETGRNITIISSETISKLPIHSLDELLKYIPGMEVQSRGPQGSQSDISMRGGTYQQVLVVLDGLRLNDPNTGHFSAYIPIAPEQIDRIEVLKGASAAIYGSDAVGGVINIITKTYNADRQTNQKTVKATVGVGQYNLVNTNLGGFLQKGKLSVDAGLLSNHSTGAPQRGTNGFFHNSSASVGVSVRVNEYWNLSARTTYDNRDFSAQNFYTTFASDTATEKVMSWWHQMRLSFAKKKTKLSLDAGYKTLNDEYAFNKTAAPNQNSSQLFQSLLLMQQQFGAATNLVTGFNFQRKQITSNDRGNHDLNVAAPFVSLSQNVGNHFSFQPSLRAEFIGSNKMEILPLLNVSLHLPGLQLRASGGRSIRDADFTERYNNYNKPQVKSGSIGNPWLVPEVSWAFEAGADWFYKSRLKLSTTLFQRYHSKLIDWVTTPYANMPRKDNLISSGTYALATNISKVNTSGFETDFQYILQTDEDQQLRLNAGVLWLYSKSSEKNLSFYISSHAKFLSNFNMVYQWHNATISLTGLYKNRNPRSASAINASVSKDYFVLNGRAAYDVVKNKLGLFVQADNIFDRQYSDLLGAPMPGRWLQGGLSFRFSK